MVSLDISHLEYSDALDKLHRACPDFSNIAITIDFSADHAQSKIIRDFVGSIFEAHGIKSPWGGRFVLITDELINNAIEHGSEEGDIDSCIIEAKKGSDGFVIVLEVHDTGNGVDTKSPDEMNAVKDAHKSEEGSVYMEKRGRGLFHITEKLVDRLEFRESPKGGLAVRIEKAIEVS